MIFEMFSQAPDTTVTKGGVKQNRAASGLGVEWTARAVSPAGPTQCPATRHLTMENHRK